MAGYDVLRQVIARHSSARAQRHGSAGHVQPRFWPHLLAIEVTPDEAMALSIELQKAALDAQQSEPLRGRSSLSSLPVALGACTLISGDVSV
jgi:hypothetical protein